ncbi:MAG: YibE/F family protein [Patescibacteria group bacterium]
MKNYLFALLSFLLFFLFTSNVSAQEPSTPQQQTFEAVITQVTEEKEVTVNHKTQRYQKLEAEITSGERKGEKITVENGTVPMVVIQDYATDDQVVITAFRSPDGKELFSITDYVRRIPLLLLFGIFVGLVILVGRKRGIASLGGMFFSFVIIFTFVLPQILAGQNPVLIVILASLAIIPLTFYLSHGFNRKTTAAVIGTIIALIITGILATIFINAARFTGFASDEANFLQAARPDVINMQGLLLAGILIGILGILDDITISQAAIVQQLKKASPNLKFHQLFLRTMDVGKDHIASTVNTLILVYTGAALPLLLLFLDNPQPIASVVNYEMIAEEIVRMLLASIGLILAVPITTAIAAWMIKK